MITVLIDDTTFADLEVFAASDGSRGLFQLIDRTVTSRGHVALKRRVTHPSVDLETLRRTQDAVRFFQAHPDSLDLDDRQIDAVTAYVESNIATSTMPPVLMRLERAWLATRYRDLLVEIDQGIRATLAFMDFLSDTAASLLERDAPPLVAEAAAELAATAAAVAEANRTSGPLLRLDRRLRIGLRKELRSALEQIGELDALRAMATATSDLGFVLPELLDSTTFSLDAEGVFHPFVEQAVANPVLLSRAAPMVFLTGPNMAGKTTYMRSVALVVLLGQVGMGVPAMRARFTPVEVLFTSLNPTDDLKAGISYFFAEVMRVKQAAEILAEDRRALVLFDEVFKGTNVHDALDASATVLLGFARARRAGLIVSSHLAELAAVLESSPAIRFCCFDGDVEHDAPRYSYRLRAGVSDQRFGLLLLRHAGVPELLEQIGR